MTTLLIDDELGRQVGRVAAKQGKSVDEFVHDVLQQAVSGRSVSRKERSGLPVIDVSPPAPIDPHLISRTLAEEGF